MKGEGAKIGDSILRTKDKDYKTRGFRLQLVEFPSQAILQISVGQLRCQAFSPYLFQHLPTDGVARILSLQMPYAAEWSERKVSLVIRTYGRVTPDWDLWRTLYRLIYKEVQSYQEWLKLPVGVRVPLLEVVQVLKTLLGRLLLSDALEDLFQAFLVALGNSEEENKTLETLGHRGHSMFTLNLSLPSEMRKVNWNWLRLWSMLGRTQITMTYKYYSGIVFFQPPSISFSSCFKKGITASYYRDYSITVQGCTILI